MLNEYFHCLLFSVPSFIFAAAAIAAPLTPENDERNVNRAVGIVNPANYYGEWPGHKYYPSPSDWRSLGIYQIITDRFRDGDPTNNDGAHGGYAPGEIGARHGGDFIGLSEKLDYIKGLGFDAIWISPIYQNLYGSPAGYGQVDYTLLDDRFGKLEEFRHLVNEAHRREMYVIVDIVVNHLSYVYYADGYKDLTPPFQMHAGEYKLLPRFPHLTYADFPVDNTFVKSGSYCDVYDTAGTKHVDSGEGSHWNSDLNHNGALTDYVDPWNNNLGAIYGKYDDLRTCSERVQEKIIAMTKSLISSTDIDGIRIDTPMQVPLSFFKKWTPAVKQHARSLGKENFLMFGETYCDPRKAAVLVGRGKTPEMYSDPSKFIDEVSSMDAGFDYAFYKTFIEPIFWRLEGYPKEYFTDFLDLQRKMLDLFDPKSKSYLRRMKLFFNSHDQRRLQAIENGIERAKLAAILISFWPGVPVWYYGDEQELTSYGTALDGHAREDMMSSIAWDGHPAMQMPNKASLDNFNYTTPTYLFVQRLMEIRRALWPILASDKIEIVDAIKLREGMLLSFVREGEKGEKLLVILNISPQLVETSPSGTALNSSCQKCEFADLLGGKTLWSGADNGLPELQFPPFSAKLLLTGTEAPKYKPRVVRIDPPHDSVVPGGSTQIEVLFDAPIQPASLSGSIRFNGETLQPPNYTIAGESKVLLTVTMKSGVNKLNLTRGIRNRAGMQMHAPLEHRFRSGDDRNPIINRSLKSDPKLINEGARTTRGPSVKLYHAAPGADFFRVKNEPNGHWSPWHPMQSPFPWSIDGTGPGWKEVTVQYWADGSGAYFVKDGIDYMLPDGVPKLEPKLLAPAYR
ncbi:MAG: hypothetical protein J5J00_05625 [Deltaproteobacteria bacterium]|nr:hypothetical protein [Deltaproteobacteria bacterium]